MPMPLVQCSIAASMLKVLRRGLLASDDDVDVIAAAKAVIRERTNRLLASGGR